MSLYLVCLAYFDSPVQSNGPETQTPVVHFSQSEA